MLNFSLFAFFGSLNRARRELSEYAFVFTRLQKLDLSQNRPISNEAYPSKPKPVLSVNLDYFAV